MTGGGDPAARTPSGPSPRDLAALGAFTALLLFLGIWNRSLTGSDAPRVAGIARAMALTGDFVVPRLNGEPFLEYPPLGYYPGAAALWLAGSPSALAALLPNVAIGVATVLATACLGASLGGRRLGLASGFLLATTASFFGLHQEALVDPALLLAITLAFAGFQAAWSRGSAAGGAILGAALGAGFLAKGLLGAGLPCAGIVVFLGVARLAGLRRAPGVGWARALGLPWGPLAAAAPVVLWVSLVAAREGEGLVREVVRQSLWRFLAPDAHHAAPWHFYLMPLLYRTLPVPFVVIAFLALRAWRARPGEPPLAPHLALPLAWFATVLAVLSVASAKRMLYLAPLYPPAALLGAALWDRVVPRAPRLRLLGPAWLAGFLVFAGAGSFLTRGFDGHDSDYVALVERAQVQSEGRRLVLYRSTEALRGAVAFLTGERVADARTVEELARDLADGVPSLVVMEIRAVDPNPLESLAPRVAARDLGEVRVGRSRIVLAIANP